MFSNIRSGFAIVRDSLLVFRKYPSMMIPVLIVWLVYAPSIIYIKHFMKLNGKSGAEVFAIGFGIIFLFATVLTFSCGIVAEFIKQIETGEPASLSRAFSHFFKRSLTSLIPLAICWSVIWFTLLVIQALVSKKDNDSDSEKSFKLSSEGVVRSLNDSPSSLKAFFDLLHKQIRMCVFLAVPGIVWHNRSFFASLKKTREIYKNHFLAFQTGFVLSASVNALIFLPIAIMLVLSGKKVAIVFPPYAWTLALIYTAFAWSYSILIEQLFCAELYLWNHKWEQAKSKLPLEKQQDLKLEDVAKPSILDEVHDLKAS